MAFDDCMGCRGEATGYLHLDGIVDELYSCLSGIPVSRVSEFELPLYANAQRSRCGDGGPVDLTNLLLHSTTGLGRRPTSYTCLLYTSPSPRDS